MPESITDVGLDVHKESIVVSLAEAGLRGRRGEVGEHGKIANPDAAIEKLARDVKAPLEVLARYRFAAGIPRREPHAAGGRTGPRLLSGSMLLW